MSVVAHSAADRRRSTRFAHKPVDPAHRARLVRLDGHWVCRGCLALYGGATAALVVGVAGWWPPLGAAALVLAVAVVSSLPSLYRRLPNVGRDLVRASAGVATVGTVAGAWREGSAVDAAIVVWLGLVTSRVLARARRRARVR